MKENSPAFQFYPGDFIGDERVQLMSDSQCGLYIRLLCYCWRELSIPAYPEQAAALAGYRGNIPPEALADVAKVLECFKPHPSEPGRLIHGRLEKEREKQRAWAAKSSLGGKRSAESRRKRGLKGGCDLVSTKFNSSSSSSRSISAESFERWWPLYPRKESKPAACKAFEKTVGSEEDFAVLMRNTPAWAALYLSREMRHRPKPTTFLNQGTWQEPPPEEGPKDFERPTLTFEELQREG